MTVRDLTVELGGHRVVENVSFFLRPGEVLGLVGPNGSGKSTLLRALVGLLPRAAGECWVGPHRIGAVRPRQLARAVAAVLQDETGDFDLTAREVVAMGRACHKSLLARHDVRDTTVVESCLARVGAAALADRRIALMSGGERQRVLIARALAQEPRVLVMDEPTNHLDVRHQFDVLAVPRELGTTAIVALHDLNLAAHFCDRVLVLHHGRPVRLGSPAEVLEPELLDDVYGVRARVEPDPDTARPHVRFVPG